MKVQLPLIKTHNFREFIVEWNYKFPADRWWRQKYNVPFLSQQHLDQSQLDIAFEFHEEQLFAEFEDRAQILRQKEQEYEKGIWIGNPKVTIQEEEDLFSKLDVMKINNQKGKIQFEE